jgi:hypothetical protein
VYSWIQTAKTSTDIWLNIQKQALLELLKSEIHRLMVIVDCEFCRFKINTLMCHDGEGLFYSNFYSDTPT